MPSKQQVKQTINRLYSFVSPLFTHPKKHLKTWLVIVGVLVASWAVVFFLRSPEPTQASWWDETWLYRKAVQISNSNGEDLEDFQVAITLDTAALIAAGKMQGDCDDLRITDQNGQILPHWIEENNPGCNNANTKVWTKVPTVYDGTDATTVYAYYGNAQASNVENGDNVFEFFDDFSTDTTENYIWSTVDTNSPVNSHNWNQENNWIEIRTGDNDAESPSKNINLPSSGHAQILMTKRLDYPSDNTQYLDIIQDGSNYYRFEWQGSAYSAQGVYKRVGGSTVDSSTESGTVNTNNAQYRIDMYWTPAKMILEIDGVERKNISTSNTTEITPTSFLFFNSQINQDWELIFINKYAATDPTTSLNAEEISPGPVAYWKFDEGTGTTAHDSSGQGNHGTFLSAPIWKTEEFCISGKCLSFDNVDDGVSITNENFTFLTDYTMCSWVAPKGNHKNYTGPIISSGDWNNVHWAFGVNQDNTRIQTRKADGVNSPWWYYTFSLTDWSYICITRDGAIITAYANGKKVGSPYTGITGNLISNATNTTIGRATYTTYFAFNGLIDEVKIYPYARTEEQIKSDYIAGASSKGSSAVFGHKTETAPITPLASKLVAYWKFDEGYGTTAHDSVGANHGTLAAGDAAPAWTNEGKVGKALSFDGSNDYITTGSDWPSIIDSNSPVTISSWVKLDDFTSVHYLTSYFANNDYLGIYGHSHATSSRRGRIIAMCTNEGSNYWPLSNGAVPLNQWTHVIYVFIPGKGYQFYINGVLDSENLNLPGITSRAQGTGYIGMFPGYSSANGLIDEVKIYNYALSEDEIKQDYNQGMAAVMGQSSANTGSTAPGGSSAQEYCVPGSTDYCTPPVAEWNFEENTGTTAHDTSGNGNDGTLVNMDNSNWVVGANGSGAALSFDGSSEYVNVPYKNLLNPPSTTIEAWIKPNTINLSQHNFIITGYGNGNTSWVNLAIANDGFLRANWENPDAVWHSISDESTTFVTDKWYHLAFSIDNSGNAKLYINGIEVASEQKTNPSDAGHNITLGGRGSQNDYWFDGLIDQVRIYDYARTPAQIAWDYNRGGPVGHWRFDECEGTVAHDVSGNENHGTINIGASAPQTSAGTCQTPGTAWGNGAAGKLNSAMSFDGVDDWVDLGQTNIMNFGANDFTISTWFKSSNNLIFYDSGSGPAGWAYVWAYYVSPNSIFRIDDGSNSVQITLDISGYIDGEWHHLIFQRNDTVIRTYIDGSQHGSDVDCSSVGSVTSGRNTWIGKTDYNRDGRTDEHYHNGLIDDVHIYNYALTPLQIKTLYNDGAVRFGD